MIYNLKNPYEVERFKQWARKMVEGQKIIEAKRKDESRTLSQNNYLHLIIAYFASQYGCGADEAKIDFYKRRCNRDIFERWRKNRRGDPVPYLRSSADLTKEEMSLSIDRFRNWSSAEAGIYLPQREDLDMMIYMRQEVERNKEYL